MDTMIGITESGLQWAQEGEVKVLLYCGSLGGTLLVRTARDDNWRIARPGEVSYGTVIELTRAADRAEPA